MPNPAYKHLYKSRRWKRLRANQLAKHPYCQCPHHVGQRVVADTVDHVEPHRGNTRLFFSPSNLQSLMASCHSAGKQRKERSGYWPGCDEQGLPIDAGHWWNTGTRAKGTRQWLKATYTNSSTTLHPMK